MVCRQEKCRVKPLFLTHYRSYTLSNTKVFIDLCNKLDLCLVTREVQVLLIGNPSEVMWCS